jgi:molybdopterin-containing oxidoreductase family membrane subunit
MGTWPNFRSPLMWDVFAVNTYFTISLLFWYMGMIPDLAAFRDRTKSPIKQFIYGLLAMGWTGSSRHWHRYERAYLILAGLATPLVLSVHSVVSFDFATSLIPGWHTTIFPPYFVAGAIFGGFAMVELLLVPARQLFGLKDFVTIRHLENMNKIILLTGTIVGYAYMCEFFTAWYSGNAAEKFAFMNRAFGPYQWAYCSMIFCNVVSPQIFWFKRFRTSIPAMYTVSILVTIGMWFERFVIIVSSLSRDFLPSSWRYFTPRLTDVLMFTGTLGFFATCFLLFCRYLPMVAIAEVKNVLPSAHPHHGDGDHGNGGDHGSGKGGDHSRLHKEGEGSLAHAK